MKNLLTHYKSALLATILCCSAGAGELAAQQSRTSYFMKSSTVRTLQNPAFRPERGYVSIPVLGMMNPSFSTNGLTLDQLVYPKGDETVLFLDPSVNTDDFLRGLKTDNRIYTSVNTQILGAGWYSGQGFWSVDLSLKSNASMSAPKTLFEFMKKGNGVEGTTYDINNLKGTAEAYLEAGVGYSRPINDKLTVGGKFKFLLGGGSAEAQIDQLHAVMNAGQWNITSEGTMNASVKGLKTKEKLDNEGNPYIDGFDVDGGGIAGYGAGIDLGASYRLTDKITLSAALLDFGFISWGKGVHGVANGNFNFDGFDLVVNESASDKPSLSDQFDSMTDDLEALIHFREQGRKKRTTMLRSTFNIGGEYELLKDKLTFGLLSSTRFYQPKAYTELTLSTSYRPINWFEAALSYSFIHSQFQTYGLALNFSPCWINFFVGSDYMLTKVSSEFIPVKSTAADFYFGISVPLSRR
ncbi:MAG: DUF5723 family protein [Bacteroides sp.]|uniref:DUF5723 family protein n=1 Tax=Bacteroides sp. TaxID=29523 RepID=UPI002FCB683F